MSVVMPPVPRRWTRSCRRMWSRSAGSTARSVQQTLETNIFLTNQTNPHSSPQVSNIVVYQEKQDESEDAEVIVKIFVEMKTAMDVKRAKNALDGRWKINLFLNI